MKTTQILIAGFGGQGVLFAGKFLAYKGLIEDKNVSWLPSYGPEMRGGTANCSIIISDTPVGSPIVSTPDCLIAMNLPSLLKYKDSVVSGGVIIVDSTLIDEKIDRDDVSVYYVPATKMAADEGLMGISVTNTTAIMVPTYGRQAMLGSNPLAISCPAEPYPFLFDASTSVITRGKVEVYNKLEKPRRDGGAIDSTGEPSSDAAEVFDCILKHKGGGILPLGGYEEATGSHKGYGYGMVVELLSSIISLGTPSSKTNTNGHSGICHGFLIIDPKIFGDAEAIKVHLSNYLDELRSSAKAAGHDRIYTHGEKEIEAVRDRMVNGISVNEKTVAEMVALARHLEMDPVAYLGEKSLDAQLGKQLYK